jgi:SEC-C motif-containing protein
MHRSIPQYGSQKLISFRILRIQCKAKSKGFGAPVDKKATQKTTCPCGSRKLYHDCCGKYHEGTAIPKTPEQLMRSRYTAYCKGLIEYIVDTTHPENPLLQKDAGVTLRKDVVATCKKISWDKLVVLESEDDIQDSQESYVTFQTFFKVRQQQGQRAQGFHTQTFIEKSRFLKEGDRWLYVDGDQDWEPNQWVGGM